MLLLQYIIHNCLFGSKCHVFVQKLLEGTGMAGVGMIIPQSDQDLILGLSLPVMGRMTGPLVPRMTEVPLVPRMAEGLLAPRTMEGPLVPRTTEGPLMPRTMEGLLVPRTTEGPLVSRTREGPPVPRRMAEVQLMRRIWCLADLQAPGVMIAVLQGLVHGHTVHADFLPSMRGSVVLKLVFPMTYWR